MDNNNANAALEYSKGFEDGFRRRKYDDGFNPAFLVLSFGLAGLPRPGADAYAAGYQDGAQARKSTNGRKAV